jgi:hypothetical protein
VRTPCTVPKRCIELSVSCVASTRCIVSHHCMKLSLSSEYLALAPSQTVAQSPACRLSFLHRTNACMEPRVLFLILEPSQTIVRSPASLSSALLEPSQTVEGSSACYLNSMHCIKPLHEAQDVVCIPCTVSKRCTELSVASVLNAPSQCVHGNPRVVLNP